MNLKRIIIVVLSAVVLFAGCKKKEETTDTKYLSGSLSFKSRVFVKVGTEYTYTPTGVKHPEKKRIGYYWKVSPNSNNGDKGDTTLTINKADTLTSDGSFTFFFGEGEDKRSLSEAKLTKHTVTAYAFATGYSTTSSTVNVVLIEDGFGDNCSITESGINPLEDNAIVDPRDNNVYYISQIGKLVWYKQNNGFLTNGTDTLAMAHYRNEPATAELFGGFYTYDAALKACPDGWRLPSEEDWLNAAVTLSGNTGLATGKDWAKAAAPFLTKGKFNGDRFWEFRPDIKIPDSPLFCAFPLGYCNGIEKIGDSKLQWDDISCYYGGAFEGAYQYAAYWTSTEDPKNSEKAYYRYFVLGDDTIHIGSAYKDSFAINVRCCKEAE
ncbi:MAG: hypothetical protein HUJ95_01410 [Bacteroidales bacterium]|nr:hypothetical protein [Bacteroidales bacterium]